MATLDCKAGKESHTVFRLVKILSLIFFSKTFFIPEVDFFDISDNNAYLTVHPLLEAQPIHDSQNEQQQQGASSQASGLFFR